MFFAALKPDDLIVDVLCKVQKLCFSSQQCMQGFLYTAPQSWAIKEIIKQLSCAVMVSVFYRSFIFEGRKEDAASYFYLWWCIFTIHCSVVKITCVFCMFCFFPLHSLNLIWTLSSYKTVKWAFSLCHLSGPKGSYYFAAQYLNSEVSHASVIIMHTFSALHTHNALSAIKLHHSRHLFSNRLPHAVCIFIMCGL